MNLSDHFTLAEFLRSDTASKYNIKNVATEQHVKNMKQLCINVLEPIRTVFNKPVIVTSGYRSNALNVTMREHGYYTSKTSQHCKGEAADIIIAGVSNVEIAKKLLNHGIIYDQCIIESAKRIDANNVIHLSNWLHISFTLDRENRMQCFKMHNGKVYC